MAGEIKAIGIVGRGAGKKVKDPITRAEAELARRSQGKKVSCDAYKKLRETAGSTPQIEVRNMRNGGFKAYVNRQGGFEATA